MCACDLKDCDWGAVRSYVSWFLSSASDRNDNYFYANIKELKQLSNVINGPLHVTKA